MNLTQNDRLKQVTSDTLIVGVDVRSQTHFCRAFDWRGFELFRSSSWSILSVMQIGIPPVDLCALNLK